MAGNSSSLTFKLFGKDVSASKAFKGVQGSASTLGGKLGGLGTAFAGIGTAAVVAGAAVAIDFGKQSVDAFIDAQGKAAAFDDAMGRFRGLSTYKGQLDALAQSLALKTKYDDDETKAAIATLARYNLTGKQLETLTPLVQDFASATGQDLGTASTLVGKALLGNTKALKSLGIVYKPTGDKAKDFANITKLLRDKVGGFAEKEGKTAAGTAAILGNQFGEVKEQVGSYLVPALTWLGQQIIGKVIPAIQVAVAWLSEKLGPVIQAVAGWIMNVAWPALQQLAAAFMKNIWPAIKMVVDMVVANLQPAITALVEYWTGSLWPAIQRLIPVLATVAKVIGIVVGAIVVLTSWILGHLIPVVLKIVGVFVTVFSKIVGVVAGAVEWVINHAGEIVDFFKSIPGKIGGFFSNLASIITAPFRIAFNSIASLWNNSVGKLSFHVPDWVPGMGGKGFDVPDIPMLANGGIVTRPTLALIGERGPEAVVPLSRGGYGGPTIVINGGTYMGTNKQQVGRFLVDAWKAAGGSGVANVKFAG